MTDMNTVHMTAKLRNTLESGEASQRLQAALWAGTHPDSRRIDVLVDRCATEPDFFVRDMLTWALVQHDRPTVVARIVPLVQSGVAQARSQALHTLSKLAEPDTWDAIAPDLLRDPDPEVTKAAWRAAVAVVPAGQEPELARLLATQFGRGDRHMRLSLSRALVALGEAAIPVVDKARTAEDRAVRTHATATATLIDDPDADFDTAVAEAGRTMALLGAPLVGE